ncbi:MAG: hypothetical protein R3C68_09655, partial [Myxococcota bacterium]
MRFKFKQIPIGNYFLSFLFAVFAAGMGCRGCTPEGPQDILQLAPKDALRAIYVADGDAFVTGVDGFTTQATRGAGRALVDRLRQGITEQLGFDPLTPESYLAAGIDLKAGALFFETKDGACLSLGIRDPGRFDKWLLATVARVDGADKSQSQQTGKGVIQSVGRGMGDAIVPVLHWTHVGRFVLLARGHEEKVLTSALERQSVAAPTQSDTLRQSPMFVDALRRLDGFDVLVMVRG